MIYRWVHQLKTPLSVIQLIAQKNGYQSDYKKISQAASQIQYDLDQVLNLYNKIDLGCTCPLFESNSSRDASGNTGHHMTDQNRNPNSI